MPAAARLTSPTDHGGLIASPPPGAVAVETVLIGGLPAAVVGSVHECVLHAELGPANVVMPNSATLAGGPVLIGGLPAATVGSPTTCTAEIIMGDPTVVIGGAL